MRSYWIRGAPRSGDWCPCGLKARLELGIYQPENTLLPTTARERGKDGPHLCLQREHGPAKRSVPPVCATPFTARPPSLPQSRPHEAILCLFPQSGHLRVWLRGASTGTQLRRLQTAVRYIRTASGCSPSPWLTPTWPWCAHVPSRPSPSLLPSACRLLSIFTVCVPIPVTQLDDSDYLLGCSLTTPALLPICFPRKSST